VAGFDAFCVLLQQEQEQQVVYKRSITTTVPAYAVDLREDPETAPPPSPPLSPSPGFGREKPALIVERKGRKRST
jgi:hypothetical protein